MVIAREDRVGVRALGRFADRYRAKHCPVGVEVDPARKVNEPWRRISNMTVENEALLDRKERRAGIKNLIDWIEGWVDEVRITRDEVRRDFRGGVGIGSEGGSEVLLSPSKPGPEGWAIQGLGRGSDATGFEKSGSTGALCNGFNGARGGTRRDCHRADDGALSASVGWQTGMSAPPLSEEPRDAVEPEEGWACEELARELVVGVCAELNISRWKLSELVREYRGISATELIDGFRVRRVKGKIAELLKQCARELWLAPGMYAGVLLMDERLKVYGGGKSEYFVDPTEDFRKKELYETISERRDALLAEFDAGWKRGGMSRDGFAMGLGFRSFSELNRACLNVYGKTARQLAWDIGCEIVDYYLAKEQKELCELAYCAFESDRVARARYLYHGTAERPAGPMSRTTLWESFDAKWRDEMGAWLEQMVWAD